MENYQSKLNDQRILVIGGAGSVASRLLQHVGPNNDVIVIDNFSSGHISNLYEIPNLNIIHGDGACGFMGGRLKKCVE